MAGDEPKPRLPEGNPIDLLDWRRRVSDLYGSVRAAKDPAAAWKNWRTARDDLFTLHPQSPLPKSEREGFSGLEYFDYDPAARVLAKVGKEKPRRYEIGTSGDGAYAFTCFAKAEFELFGELRYLELYWLEGYGGGVFLPFADGTSGKRTYGAGRYLLDTVKGADLGMHAGKLVLDFNFAYNPSCSYDPSWVCPLATPANRIELPITAGERHTAA
ncbi:MAG: DUF1684 domain-containing protein [Solirubrobacterales bacterium]|nr:DUF1684 domain-containing protein [Solirubrobacterales bacterium]